MSSAEWWHEYGSGIRVTAGDDYEEHAIKGAALAWKCCKESYAKICEKQNGEHDKIYAQAIRDL